MTVKRVSPQREAGTYIASLTPFQASALSGMDAPAWDTARLSSPWREQYAADRNADLIDYTVRSYGTPIAWHTTDGRWIVPDQRFSVTTTRHQGIVRRAVGWIDLDQAV